MEFHIESTEVYGLNKAVIASGNAMRTIMANNLLDPTDKDLKRAALLGTTGPGEGHDNFLNGIIVQFDLYAPLYMWKQIQRYHFLDFISSQSTMHRLLKFDVATQCVSDTDPVIVRRYQDLVADYNAAPDEAKWRTLVASLPCGFVLGATMTTNYRQLKTIYLQRRNHKLKEWHDFCAWCETLPLFTTICLGEGTSESKTIQK